MAAELLTSEVSEGVELPVLEKDVKPVTVVLGAMASRDWRPSTTTTSSRPRTTA